MEPTFQSEQIPTYHEGMLILKVRSIPEAVKPMVAPGGAAGFSSPDVTEALSGSPGLSALSIFERAGLIKQVVPLSRPVEERMTSFLGAMGAMGTLAASVDAPMREDRNAGVNLVQVENDSDVPDLRKDLANDPNVEFVSRVPVRYLTVDPPGVGVTAVPRPSPRCGTSRRFGGRRRVRSRTSGRPATYRWRCSTRESTPTIPTSISG